MKNLYLTLLGLCHFCFLIAQDSPSEISKVKKKYFTERIENLSLQIDGKLDDEAWNQVLSANMAKEPGVKPGRPNPFGLPDLLKPNGWIGPDHEGNHGDFPNAV